MKKMEFFEKPKAIEKEYAKEELENERMRMESKKEEEMKKKENGESYSVHFDFINPKDLTEKELKISLMYQENLAKEDVFLEESLKRDEELKMIIIAIQNEDSKEMLEHPEDSRGESRENFDEYLLNKLNNSHLQKQLRLESIRK